MLLQFLPHSSTNQPEVSIFRLSWTSVSPIPPLQAVTEHQIELFRHKANSQVALVVRNLPANAGDARDVGSIPGGGKRQPTPVFLPENFHRQKEPSRLQSMGSQIAGHNRVCVHTHTQTHTYFTYGHVCVSMLFAHFSHSLLPPLCQQVYSVCLCLCSCTENRFINIIFLDSTNMH